MFALFFSLYVSMFSGSWNNYTYADIFSSSNINTRLQDGFNSLGRFLTNVFSNAGNYETFGRDTLNAVPTMVAFVLSLITSIGIVIMAVKGIKRVFSIFFMPIR